MFGVYINLANPAVPAMATDVVRSERPTRAIATTGWAAKCGPDRGPLLGGLIAERSFRLRFVTETATTLAFAAIIYRGALESKPGKNRVETTGQAISSGGSPSVIASNVRDSDSC